MSNIYDAAAWRSMTGNTTIARRASLRHSVHTLMGIGNVITNWCLQRHRRNVERLAHDQRAWSKFHNYCLQKGREIEFVEFCRTYLQQHPTHRHAWAFFLVSNRELIGDLVTFCQDLVRAHPRDEQLWDRLDEAWGHGDDLRPLVTFCEQLVVNDPDCLPAWLRLARAYKIQNRMPKLLEAAQNVLRLRPDDAQMWCNLGDAFAASRQYSEAIAAFQKTLQLRPTFVKALYSLGNVYQQENRHREAAEMYEKAIKINPQDSSAWVWLVMAYIELGEFQKAKPWIQKLEREVPVMGQMLKDEMAQRQQG